MVAALLGLSRKVLRKRTRRGIVPAHKANGRWFVLLDRIDISIEPGTIGDRDSTPGGLSQAKPGGKPDTSSRAVSSAALSQLEAIRDEWLQPLVDKLTVQATQIGRLESEGDQAIRWIGESAQEREEMAAEIELLRQLTRPLREHPAPSERVWSTRLSHPNERRCDRDPRRTRFLERWSQSRSRSWMPK